MKRLIPIFLIPLLAGCLTLTPPSQRAEKPAKGRGPTEIAGHLPPKPTKAKAKWERALISNRIRAIAVDPENIWIGTDKGVSRFIKSEGRWVHYTKSDGLSSDVINAIAVDGDTVWFATDEGVTRFNPKTGSWRIYRSKDGLASDRVQCIAVDGSYVWFGTDGGLNRYDKRIDSWAVRTKKEGLPSDNITAIAVDQEYVWVGMGKERKDWRIRRFWEPRRKPGEGGVSRYHKATDSWNSYTARDGLVGEEITAIAIDEDSVWFGTRKSGISLFSKTDQAFVKAFSKADLLTSDMITAILVDGNQVWIATANGGVQRYIKSVNTWINYRAKDGGLPSDHITCIAVDGNDVWFGTYESGAVKFNKVTGEWTVYTVADRIADNDVRDIDLDGNGSIWIATPSGLSLFDPESSSWRNFDRKDGMVSDYLTSVLVTPDEVWVGTERGVQVLERRSGIWRFFGSVGGRDRPYVMTLSLIDGKVWAGLSDGLVELEGGKWRRIEAFDGRRVTAIGKWRDAIWVGTEEGLYRLGSGDPQIVLKGRIRSIAPDGERMFVGTVDGVYGINPEGKAELIAPDLCATAILPDKAGLWIGTPTGLFRMGASGELERVEGISYLVRRIVRAGGYLYLATDTGLIRYDPDGGAIEAYRNRFDRDPLLNPDAFDIQFDGDYIWFSNWAGTPNGCILRYHRPTDTWRRFTRFDIFKDPKVRAMTIVRRITVDGDYVWFSTDNGLLRYDKARDLWERFSRETGLPSDDVDLVVPAENHVWVSYENLREVTRISRNSGEVESFDLGSGLPWDTVAYIAVDGDQVWVGTRMNVFRYDASKGEWRKFTIRDGLGGHGARWIAADERYVWVASAWTRDGGRPLSRYDKKTGRWETFSEADVLADDEVDKIIITPEHVWILYEPWSDVGITGYDRRTGEWFSVTPKGEWGTGVMELCEDGDYLWLGTFSRGVMRLHMTSGTWTSFDRRTGLLHDHVNERALKVDDRYVWVGTPFGICRYDKKLESWTYFVAEKSLLGREVRALAVDDRYVWVGTTSGLSRYDKIYGAWENYRQRGGRQEMRIGGRRIRWWEPPSEEGLINNWVNCLAVDDRYVWIGTREGVNRYDKVADRWDGYKRENGLPDEDITSIAISGGDVWVGTNRGIGRFPRNSDNPNAWVSYTSGIEIKPGAISKEFAETLVSDEVWCIAVDDKYVWVGTRMGVSRYDKRRDMWKTFTKEDGLPDDKITAIAADERWVWFGSDKGAAVYDKRTKDWRTYTTKDGLISDKVTCIAIDGDLIWFGTYDAGVSVFDTKNNSWKGFTKEDGLAHNTVYSIAIDGRYVWIGTQRGLSRYDKKTGSWTTFTETHWPEDI